MRAHHKIRLRLRSLFRRRSIDRELDDEICFHLDQLVEENAAAGMTPEEARRSAVSTMGGISQFQEECRDMRRINFIDGLLRDLQYAGRMMQRNPVFTGIAILTLALGIGPTSIIFSVVDTALLKPLPFRDPDRLLSVWGRLAGIGLVRDQNGVSPPEYTDLCVRNRVFEGAAAHDTGSLTLTGDGEPERIEAAFVTASFFPLLGVQPATGRAFTADDKGGTRRTTEQSRTLTPSRLRRPAQRWVDSPARAVRRGCNILHPASECCCGQNWLAK